jgi:Fe2+ transport system protein FeoA
MVRPLTDLAAGEGGRLCTPRDGVAIPTRLLDLGFVPGTSLRVLRRAPLGDPIEIELRGYRVCLRHSQLVALEVEPETGA